MRRILLDNSSYGHCNVGDAAMLQVAIERLQRLFPGARIRVLTANPDRILNLCPNIEPVDLRNQPANFSRSFLPRFKTRFPWRVQEFLRKHGDTLLVRFGSAWKHVAMCLRMANADQRKALVQLLTEIECADLVVATGGGYINDEFASHCQNVLMMLLLAASRNKRIAMTGQGLGPLESPSLTSLAQAVFPKLEFLGLRETRNSPAIAKRLGAKANRIIVTGDDAIELAHSLRPHTLGGGLGFNLRSADYAGLSDTDGVVIGRIVSDFVLAGNVPLIPAAISRSPKDVIWLLEGEPGRERFLRTNKTQWEDDMEEFWRLFPHLRDNPAVELPLPTPEGTCRAIGRCRLVVTGSYHAGVFALAQGIPIVGLAKSPYYVDKFEGLRAQFGSGVHVIHLVGDIARELKCSIEELWYAAPTLRPKLLNEAESQVCLGQELYNRIAQIEEHESTEMGSVDAWKKAAVH